MKQITLYAALAAFGLFIMSCSNATSDLTNSESYPENISTVIDKALVVGVSDNRVVRNRYEQDMVKQLEKHKVSAVGSFKALPRNEAISREAFEKYFSEHEVDVIIITNVASAEQLAGYQAGQEYSGGGDGKPMAQHMSNYYNYYFHTWDRADATGQFQYGELLRLETFVYDVSSENLVWHGSTKSFSKDNTEKLLDDLSKLLVKTMREDGIIN